jgi:integrase
VLLLGTRPLSRIDQSAVLECYEPRNGVLTKKAGASTKVRQVITPLRAVLNHASYLGWCAPPRLKGQKVGKPRTPYLKPEEATALVRAAAPHLRPLLAFLIGTGCRMSEALELTWADVDLRGAQATVMQKDPSGEGRERHVHLWPVVLQALSSLPHREGIVFRPARPTAEHCRPRAIGQQIAREAGKSGRRGRLRAHVPGCRESGTSGGGRTAPACAGASHRRPVLTG